MIQVNFTVPNIEWPDGVKWCKTASGWLVGEVDVTPALATAILELNADNQRHHKPRAIEKFARDMSNNAWRLVHQGIAFNRSGNLHDGQNRLWAVVESGATVRMFVWLGAGDDSAMAVIDNNTPRTDMDAANVVRMDIHKYGPPTLWAAIKQGVKNGGLLVNKLSRVERLEALARHAERITKVVDWFGSTKPARRIGQAPVRGAVFSCVGHIQDETLARFVAVLTEQDTPAEHERAAWVLKKAIEVGDMPDREMFLKTIRAAQFFADRETPTKLYAPSENPYPVEL